jgi:cell division protein ZipA
MRLITPPDRPIEGVMLQLALDEEGLVFGRYSVFHRLAEDVPVFSVASLVEPGNFRPEDMPGRQYPGASLFAVFPGPQPAPLAFDDMVATARRLAERLDAVLQDETGSSLTSQRIKTIREELVQFEHLRALARSHPAG